MNMDYIRKVYGLDCKIGDPVRYTFPGDKSQDGVIIGTMGACLRVKFPKTSEEPEHVRIHHPTGLIEYL